MPTEANPISKLQAFAAAIEKLPTSYQIAVAAYIHGLQTAIADEPKDK